MHSKFPGQRAGQVKKEWETRDRNIRSITGTLCGGCLPRTQKAGGVRPGRQRPGGSPHPLLCRLHWCNQTKLGNVAAARPQWPLYEPRAAPSRYSGFQVILGPSSWVKAVLPVVSSFGERCPSSRSRHSIQPTPFPFTPIFR